MIIKSYQTKNLNIIKDKLILFHGINEGLKKEEISNLVKPYVKNNLEKFDEKEILDNKEDFFNTIYSKSLFNDNKIILINRASDKITKIIEEILEKDISDVSIIINSESLDKKSKLRQLFEKNKNTSCVAFYADNNDTLFRLCNYYLRQNKIIISRENIYLIINKCNGDRGILINELEKIKYFHLNKKTISREQIIKLTNLIENHSVSNLVDNCLAKNQKKTLNILNENNYANEDCVLILRIFLNKSKKILRLLNEYKKNKDINLTISKAKPPIFWKDKEITKQQILEWNPKNLKLLIYKLNDLELTLKKNINNSVNLISDFLIEQSSAKTNN